MSTTLVAPAPASSRNDTDGTRPVAADVAALRTMVVNVVLVGPPGGPDRGWTLVDAGMPGTARSIAAAARARFGGARPGAIVLTHGHFDHVGALRTLADRWDVPIYAHPLEFPYLDGRSAYPPPDPSVGGGMMSRLAPLYPRGPIDVSHRLRRLPEDGTVPGMAGWRWIHTPGHTPGHVALFRDADRVLVAGDAFVTTRQESLRYLLLQEPQISGPPRYYTTDWAAARRSVQALAALQAEAVVTGHGPPLSGEAMRGALHLLADDFAILAVPSDGRYVRAAAEADGSGVLSVPPRVVSATDFVLAAAGTVAAGVAIGALVRGARPGRRDRARFEGPPRVQSD